MLRKNLLCRSLSSPNTINVLIVIVVFGVVLTASGMDGDYDFIIYPITTQSEIDALGIDLGAPREHPDGTLCLTNRNGNLPFTTNEVNALDAVENLIFIGSDTIDVYLQANGWNGGGVH